MKLVGEALDVERRKAWNELRRSDNPDAAKKFKGARWALLKKPSNLNDDQAATLRKLKRRGGDVWRAYTLKEALRAIFAGDLTPKEVEELIDRWISRATRSRLPAFVKAAKTTPYPRRLTHTHAGRTPKSRHRGVAGARCVTSWWPRKFQSIHSSLLRPRSQASTSP